MRADETVDGEPDPVECVVALEFVLGDDDGLPEPVRLEVIGYAEVHLQGRAARPAHLARPHLPWRRPGEW
jgi:hypothetical protein